MTAPNSREATKRPAKSCALEAFMEKSFRFELWAAVKRLPRSKSRNDGKTLLCCKKKTQACHTLRLGFKNNLNRAFEAGR